MGKLSFKNIDENIKKLSSLDSFSENQSKALENYKTAKTNLLTALGAVFVFGAMTVTMFLKASTSLAAISVVFGVIMTILSLFSRAKYNKIAENAMSKENNK